MVRQLKEVLWRLITLWSSNLRIAEVQTTDHMIFAILCTHKKENDAGIATTAWRDRRGCEFNKLAKCFRFIFVRQLNHCSDEFHRHCSGFSSNGDPGMGLSA